MQGDVSGIDSDDIDAVIIEGKKMSKEEYFKNKNTLKEIEELRKKCVGWWDIKTKIFYNCNQSLGDFVLSSWTIMNSPTANQVIKVY